MGTRNGFYTQYLLMLDSSGNRPQEKSYIDPSWKESKAVVLVVSTGFGASYRNLVIGD